MSTVLMMFLFPIGIAFLIYEIKDKKRYQYIFDSFFDEVSANRSYAPHEKILHVQKMLEHNEYHIVSKSETEIVAEKKILSIGILFISLGFFYIGVLIYLVYFFAFQKPHRLKFTV